jgi:hypothetical protein
MNIKINILTFVSKKLNNPSIQTRRSIISNQLCNKTIEVVSLKARTNGMLICKLLYGVKRIYPNRSNEQKQATNVK